MKFAPMLKAALIVLAATFTTSALAAYPDKPIKIIVGFTPGGTADAVGRILAQNMSPRLGQGVVVENKAGANGNLATEFVQRSVPDSCPI